MRRGQTARPPETGYTVICWFSLKKGLWCEVHTSGNIRKNWSSWGASGVCAREPPPQLLLASSTSCRTYSCSI